MHACKPTITPWFWLQVNFKYIPHNPADTWPFFSMHFFYQRFVQEFLGFEYPCRRNISLKHKPLTLVDSIWTCLRHSAHSGLWLTRRGPTCAYLFVIHPPVFWLTERSEVGWGSLCSFHNYQLSPILQRRGDGNITGRIPLETEKRELILCLVFIFPVAGLLSPCIVSAVNEKGKGGCGVGRGGGGGVVRKRDRKGLKASLWMTKT